MRIHWRMLVCVLLFAEGAFAQTGALPATLRVGLWTLWHDKQVVLSPTSGASANLRLCATCEAKPIKEQLLIQAKNDALIVPGKTDASAIFVSGALTLEAHHEKLTLENPLKISARSGQLILTVTLPKEKYVERVVASESGPADGIESLKALAVVVRSFALHQKHGHADYDLCDSTHCQLLHWDNSAERRAAAHAATLSTAGETLWYRGQRAAAWFHQNCGGRTASPGEVWPGSTGAASKPMPWLISHVDPYCTRDGVRAWSDILSRADLTTALANQGLVRPGWSTLTVARRGESGRAVTLLAGSTKLSAEDFRLAVGRTMGWGHILSTWFEISQQGDQFAFHGRGSGHGVGLCQAGAAAMASQGRDAAQILAEYFPGTTVADELTGQSWQSFAGKGLTVQSLVANDAALMPIVNDALADAESRAGIEPAGMITVRSYRTTEAFREATLAPGWVAAFTEGNAIATQPLATLSQRKLLVPTLRHEFLHVILEQHSAPSTPLWLREGLVEFLADSQQQAKHPGPMPSISLDQLDRALSHAKTEAESAAAHRAAGWYAARLVGQYGKAQVMAWLQSGLPASAVATTTQRDAAEVPKNN
jgi:stage II sporulation protein D (peptidoglycan lytic transglycosylase)